MIVKDLKKYQHVIPRWLGYRKSLEDNELGLLVKPQELEEKRSYWEERVEACLGNWSPKLGGDLYEKLVLDQFDDLAIKLAPSILNAKNLASPLRKLAEQSLLGEVSPYAEPTYDEKIHIHKNYLKEFPRNGIRWVEVARLYAIKRQKEHALRALRIAYNINPRDRYTIRSLLRFYLHADDTSEASKLLGKNIGAIADPWLRGVGLSALLIDGKSPTGRRLNIEQILGEDKAFDNSEFIAAAGMLHLELGKDKYAKRMFKHAWLNPSYNVSTHAEWVTRSILPDLRQDALTLKRTSSEALAGEAFATGEWVTMSDHVQSWAMEEPYSTKPFKLLAYAGNIRGDYGNALSWILKIEKNGGADFGIVVSKIYALISLNQIGEATKIISDIDVDTLDGYKRVVILANIGFLLIKSAELKKGLDLYLTAERGAKKFSADLANRVFIYSMVASKEAGRDPDSGEMMRLQKLAKSYSNDIAASILFRRIDISIMNYEAPNDTLLM